ncbi:MAG: ribosome maturation factor RimP [Myxococcota bacterium]
MDPLTLSNTVRALIGPAVERLEYDLVAIEWTGTAGRPVLRVSIDRPSTVTGKDGQTGITARSCTIVSRNIEPLLDAADPVTGSYTLEVSSPGIERPIQRLSDYDRFAGLNVRIRLESGAPRRRFTGRIIGTRDDDVVIEADGEEHSFHVDTIERAHLDLTLEEFEAIGAQASASPGADT